MSVVCELAAPYVANSAVDGDDVIRPFRHHASTCLRCQARHAAMMRAAREFAAMERERLRAPLDLEWRVMSSLEGDLAVAWTWRKPVAVLSAVASMAVVVVAWRLRFKVG
jgi:hypothetical protein